MQFHSVSERILEVRFKPEPRIVDYRGSWVLDFTQALGLSKWQIAPDFINMADDSLKTRAFLGVRSLGFVAIDASKPADFEDLASKFLRTFFSKEFFADGLFVTRIGIRSRFYTRFDHSFSDLMLLFRERFFDIKPSALKLFNATLVDIGGPVNFTAKNGKFNVANGPMEEKQACELLSREGPLFPVGLFFDMDYSTEPAKELMVTDITRPIFDFTAAIEQVHTNICNLVMAD
jgi:hypothetical protein